MSRVFSTTIMREDRQDAEAGHGDDQEQQHVEDALLDGDGRQQRPLLLLPGLHAGSRRPGTSACSASTTSLASRVVLQLDLDAGDAVLHRPQVLQVVERHEDVVASRTRSSPT